MSVSVTLNGTTYTIPETGDTSWGTNVTSWIQAVSQHCLQKTGGTFVLSSELDLGGSFGIKALYLRTRTANPALSGVLRLANTDSVVWRNAANSGDIELKPAATDGVLKYNSIDLVGVSLSQTLTNKTLDASSNTISNLNTTHLASGILDTDLSSVSGSDDTLPSAKAVKTYSDAHSTATTSVHGIADTSVLVTLAGTETLTNKTIVAANNTITTAASGNLAATSLNAALSELQTDIDTRATSSDLTTHTGASTSIHGIADTSALVTLTGSQTLTNKKYSGGTASASSKFVLASNTKANLDSLGRESGSIYWASDEQKAYIDNGTTLRPVGGGSTVTSSVQTISASGTITANTLDGFQMLRVKANTSGGNSASTTPLGSSSYTDGQQFTFVGQDDDYPLTIPYSDTAKGCLLNGDANLFKGSSLTVIYDSTLNRFVEVSRNA